MSPTDLPPSTPPTASDLTDADLDTLAGLLASTPEPLEPMTVAVLDGYLCGVIVQPVLLRPEQWLPQVFDLDGEPLPQDADPAWRERVTALIVRHHAALNRAIVEDGWFDPVVVDFDEDHPIAVSEYEPLAALPPVSQALAPWVVGFRLAQDAFGQLRGLGEPEIDAALARLERHLPPPPGEASAAPFDPARPLEGLDAAIDELVATVVELSDLTQDLRYHVETVRRESPKIGRNDPCPCGSGSKYKHCHGAR
jgi:uncharacterized protein